MSTNQTRVLVLSTLAALIPLSFWRAPYPNELVLQHLPTVIAIALLLVWVLRVGLSRLSFVSLVTFVLLHSLGARWIYSFVPYDDWTENLFGVSLSQWFGWERNHYDRLVHFASGLLFLPPSSEVLQRFGGMKPLGAAVTGIAIVLAIGAVYEIIEWQIATVCSPAQAESYNGQQGDSWDPQKDMALAWLGSILAAASLFRWKAT